MKRNFLRLPRVFMSPRALARGLFPVLAVSAALFAEEPGRPQLVDAPISAVYAPSGFDDNDNVQIVIEGAFPNSCYWAGPVKVAIQGKRIEVKHEAHFVDGHCYDMVSLYMKVVDVGILKADHYEIYLSEGGAPSALLPVKKAKPQNKNDEPGTMDDYLYVPVKKAAIVSRNPHLLRLEGVFPSGAMQVDRVMISPPVNQVIDILPIAKVDETKEKNQGLPVSFIQQVDLSSIKVSGRFLIHIRSLNGMSVNLIEDL